MSDKPIIFSSPMIRTLLDGRKIMTRRVLKPKSRRNLFSDYEKTGRMVGIAEICELPIRKLNVEPYAVGDILWVREAWSTDHHLSDRAPRMLCPAESNIWYWADGNPSAGDWTKPKPSIHMPRWASRLTLTVTAVKVERLQEISRADAIAEGLSLASNAIEEFWRWPEPHHEHLWLSPVAAYRWLWESLHGPGSWAENPFVAAISFTVDKRNIDA